MGLPRPGRQPPALAANPRFLLEPATIKLLTDHKENVIVWRVQIHAKVAQLVEHSTENAGVVGSIPSLGTNEETYKA